MYRLNDATAIATATDLRRRTREIMEAAEEGADVIVQRGDEPVAVYMSFERYQEVLARLDRLESFELAEVALRRKRRIDAGETEPVPLEEMLRRHAPELLAEVEEADTATSGK